MLVHVLYGGIPVCTLTRQTHRKAYAPIAVLALTLSPPSSELHLISYFRPATWAPDAGVALPAKPTAPGYSRRSGSPEAGSPHFS